MYTFDLATYVKAASKSLNAKSGKQLSHLKFLNRIAQSLQFHDQEKMMTYFKKINYENVHLQRESIRSRFNNWIDRDDTQWLANHLNMDREDVDECLGELDEGFHTERMFIFNNAKSMYEIDFDNIFNHPRSSGYFFPGFGLIRLEIWHEMLISKDMTVYTFPRYVRARCFDVEPIRYLGPEDRKRIELAICNIVKFFEFWKDKFDIPLYVPETEISDLYDHLMELPEYTTCMTLRNEMKGILVMNDSNIEDRKRYILSENYLHEKFDEPSIHQRYGIKSVSNM